MRPIQLALCGTSNRLTYGDALASLIIEDALRQRLGDLTLLRYASSVRSANSWPYGVRSLDAFERDMPGFNGVLIGNLESLSLASAPSQNLPANGDLHESAGSWLAPALAALTAGIPVCWNSAAVRDVPGWARPSLAFALSLSRYVSARDEDAVATFRTAGFNGDSPIVPSVLFEVPRLIAGKVKGAPRPETVKRWLHTTAADEYVVIQDHQHIRPLLSDLEKALALRGMTPVLLPLPELIDPTDVETPVLARTATHPLAPESIAALIGHSAGVVALDEDIITTALAYGIAVLLPPGDQGAKATVTADEVVTGLPEDPVPDAFLERLGSFILCARARNAASILDVHWNNLAAQFGQRPTHDQGGMPASYFAWNRLLISQEQALNAAAALPSSSTVQCTDTESRLRAELELMSTSLIEARAQHQLEAGLHQTWRTTAEQRRAEIETERQRLHEMKHSFDAALDALTRENAALKDKHAQMLEALRQREADLLAREDEIDQLRSSFSWRLTGPLRSAKNAWRMRQR